MTPDAEALGRLLGDRRSCRAFDGRPVPEDVIRRMLALAQRTPSWCNCQPWQAIVTSGEGTERFRRAFLEAATAAGDETDIPLPEAYRGVYQERRRAAGYGLYASVGIERSDREGRFRQNLENFRLFGAPHVLVVHSDRSLGPYGAVDCGAYIATFLLAAQAEGVATIAQATVAMRSPLVHAHFGLGDDRLVIAGVSFGYAADHPVNRFRTERASIDEAATWVRA